MSTLCGQQIALLVIKLSNVFPNVVGPKQGASHVVVGGRTQFHRCAAAGVFRKPGPRAGAGIRDTQPTRQSEYSLPELSHAERMEASQRRS